MIGKLKALAQIFIVIILAALVWALLPGVYRVARRYHYVERIDFIVAEQLWMQACEFPWQTKTKVAAKPAPVAKPKPAPRATSKAAPKEAVAKPAPEPAVELNEQALMFALEPVVKKQAKQVRSVAE